MLSSAVAVAQGYYHQTGAASFARTQLSGLSAVATRPPAFSDNPSAASSMSPNNWGESAIRNPYAGYGDVSSGTSVNAMPLPAPSFVGQQTQTMPNTTSTLTSVLSPPSASLANDAVTSDAATNDAPTSDALTNTDYSRSDQRPDRYADASFALNKDIKLPQKPALPAVEFPGQKVTADTLGTIPFDLLAESTVSQQQPTASLGGVITPEISNQQSVVAQSVATKTRTTRPRHLKAQPFVSQSGHTLFTPTQDQPAYVVDAPQATASYIAPSNNMMSSLISNELGLGYSQFGQQQNQSFIPTTNQAYGQGFGTPMYRSNVGHRAGYPTTRNHTILDQGELFDNENKKKEFPPFKEIIATGRFFGSAELAFLRPHFVGNTAFSIDGPEFSQSIPFDFDNETAPHLRFGFESKYGPGFEFNYFTLNANSESVSQSFDGVSSVNTIAAITGPNRFSQLSADSIGQTLDANHSFEIETYGFNVFKDIQFKVTKMGGRFGFIYANVAQSLEASVTDGGGVVDTLNSTSDFRGFGPQVGLDYYRPVGHTPLEFVTSVTGAGLFGRRDQFVNNTAGLVERRFGADEFMAKLDLRTGLQYKKTVAENRAVFARLSFVHQTWLGGGTAVDPTGDFGLKGVTFGVGYNR
jgi:hypothetical protein